MPGPKRRGVSGWLGPKSYVRDRGPYTSSMRGTIAGVERRYSGPLLDKLGVRPGMRVALVDIDAEAIGPLLADRTSDLTTGWPEPETDVILLGADSTDALLQLESLSRQIRPNGAIWVVSRKGKSATLRDVDVIDGAKAAGLVDNKVVSFSSTHTALRLVIPVA